jgi:hypothetical protein
VKFPSNLPKKCLFLAVGIFNIVESYDMGPLEGVLRIFVAFKNLSSAGFEPANHGYSGKHKSH